jgi:type I restriction enzyme S subunit
MFALLRSKAVNEQIGNMHVGTLIPHFKKGDFDKLFLEVPDRDIQVFAGDLYLSLSKRIDSLERINESLEAIAMAIFRSWFVDFDPVRAKAEGREPEGMDADTAALFPCEYQESELGLIPVGWTVKSIGEISNSNQQSIGRGYTHSIIQYVDISSVEPGRIVSSTAYALVDAPSRAKRLVTDGDVIWSCVRPNRRSYALVLEPQENLVVSTGFVTLTAVHVPFSFLYLSVTTEAFVDYLATRADGAAYPAVRPDTFEEAKLIVPSAKVVNSFHELIEPMLRSIRSSARKSELLADLRDTLLPRLISGKLRVPEAEKIVEAVL